MKALLPTTFRAVALLLLLAALIWPLPDSPARPAGGLPVVRFCIDVAAIVTEEEAAAIQRSGAQMVRLILSWAAVEPKPPAGSGHVYDWSEPDTMLGILEAQHLDVLLTIRDNPDWAAPQPNGPVNSEQVASYYDFVRAAVTRYSAAPHTVRAWEVYNEEDSQSFFGRRAADYAAVLRQDYGIIKGIDPSAAVYMGGLAYDFFLEAGGPFVPSFLADLLAAGAAPYTDAINIHGYSNSHWGSVAATVASVRAALAKAGVEDKPLIWTEGGTSSSGPYGPDGQAAYVAQLYATAQGQGVQMMTWFPFQDFTTSNPGITYFQTHGLIGLDGTPKPAYRAYQVAAGYLTATTPLRVQGASEFSDGAGEGYTFQRPDGGGLVVAWATGEAARQSWPATHVRAVRDVYGQAVTYSTSGDQAVIPLSRSPAYIELDTPSRFADVPLDFWGQPAVEELAARGAVAGYGGAAFQPGAPSTRGQLSKMLVAARGWPLVRPSLAHFRDVPPGSPFYPYVETALAHRVIAGYSDGTFRPQAAVTRGQLSTTIARALDWAPVPAEGGPRDFVDVLPGQPFYGYIEAVYARGVAGGYADETFRPEAVATRAQLAKMIALAVRAGR